jgi:hypothetical protein
MAIKFTPDVIKSIDELDFLQFNNLIIKHKDLIISEAKSNLRFRQVFIAKLKRFYNDCNLAPIYLQYGK